MRKVENAFALCLLAVSLAVFYGSLTVRVFVSEPLTAKTYGMIISGLLAAACITQLAKNIMKSAAKAEDKPMVIKEKLRMVIIAVMTLFYCYGINNIGYFTSTFLFLTITMIVLLDVLSWKSIVKCSAFSLVFCIALKFMFDLMLVYMPNTPLI